MNKTGLMILLSSLVFSIGIIAAGCVQNASNIPDTRQGLQYRPSREQNSRKHLPRSSSRDSRQDPIQGRIKTALRAMASASSWISLPQPRNWERPHSISQMHWASGIQHRASPKISPKRHKIWE